MAFRQLHNFHSLITCHSIRASLVSSVQLHMTSPLHNYVNNPFQAAHPATPNIAEIHFNSIGYVASSQSTPPHFHLPSWGVSFACFSIILAKNKCTSTRAEESNQPTSTSSSVVIPRTWAAFNTRLCKKKQRKHRATNDNDVIIINMLCAACLLKYYEFCLSKMYKINKLWRAGDRP